MNLKELRDSYRAILETAKNENRSLTLEEDAQIETLKKEIATAEKNIAKQADEQKSQNRSIAASQSIQSDGQDTSSLMRSIAKGGNDLGTKEFINDVVRVFEEESPIFAKHSNVQKRSTGNTFCFTRVTPGGAGYGKTEGQAGTEDTASTLAAASVSFVTYSGQEILITQEAFDDAAADIATEMFALGMSKSTDAFDAAAIAVLEGAVKVNNAFVESSGSTWTIDDLVTLYFSLPNRHRQAGNIVYICNAATAAAIVSLMSLDDSPKSAIIGLNKDSIVVDDNVTDDVVLVANVTRALALAMKVPVRVVKLDCSEGYTYEVQPRLAVALRDSSAVVGFTLGSGS